MDFCKAFDAVPHGRLLVKLQSYGITGNIYKWVEDFLKDRVQCVRVGNACSSETSVLSGIPQGSVLGPILFTIFINDLPDCVSGTCKVFADDTKIYNVTKNRDQLQTDIDKMTEWTTTWNLYFNVDKCKVMHAWKKNPQYDYVMKTDDKEIVMTKCTDEKDLGVVFDGQLRFDKHIHLFTAKANRMLGLVKRAFPYMDADTFTKLFKSLVRPHLEYGNAIWHP